MTTFIPCSDRILVEVKKTDEKSSGGIILPENQREKPQTGTVIAVGPGKRDPNGLIIPMHIQPGDVVYFSPYAGRDKYEDNYLLKEEDILGILVEDNQ